PALSQTCYEMIIHAIEIAKKHGVTIIFDPNIREKLWSTKQDAKDALLEIASKADILLPGVSEAAFFYGEKSIDEYAHLFLENGSSLVILKEGSKGSHYYTDKDNGFVPSYQVSRVVDPIGAGDGFAAGVISGLLEELPLEKAVARGNAI